MNISIVIPTYKKVDQLLKNMDLNMPYFKGHEVVVVNDDPDTSLAPLKAKYPEIIIIQNPKNLGFAGAINEGIKAATGSHVLLLNNDVILHDAGFENAISHFEQGPTLFAVGFAQHEQNDDVVGRNTIRWEDGFAQHAKAAKMEAGISAWAEGGASLFDKAKLIEMGMFNTIYSPFYWEDTDLGYRAWKYGYTIQFDPTVIMEHHHESTISSFFSLNKIKTIAYRNQFFFIWMNISDQKLWNSHISQLPVWLLRMTLKGELSFISGFLQALGQLGAVRKSRVQNIATAKKTDQEILAQFSS